MTTREVPRLEWAAFFDDFSQRHLGELTTVSVLGADIGVQTEARRLPLAGISVDTKGSEEDSIDILLGVGRDDHLTHHIEAPTRVWSKQDGDVPKEAVEIDSGKGIAVLVQFEPGA